MRVQIHELPVQIHKFWVQIRELRVQIPELRVQIHKLRVQIYDLHVQIRKFKVTSYELKSIISKIILKYRVYLRFYLIKIKNRFSYLWLPKIILTIIKKAYSITTEIDLIKEKQPFFTNTPFFNKGKVKSLQIKQDTIDRNAAQKMIYCKCVRTHEAWHLLLLLT